MCWLSLIVCERAFVFMHVCACTIANIRNTFINPHCPFILVSGHPLNWTITQFKNMIDIDLNEIPMEERTEIEQVNDAIKSSKQDHLAKKESRSSSEKKLAVWLKKSGLQITDRSRQVADGNCWASAISFALQDLDQFLSASQVRKLTIQALKDAASDYSPFVIMSTGQGASPEEYIAECEAIQGDGQWKSDHSNIGDLLVEVFASYFKLSIIIYGSDESKFVVGNPSNRPNRTITIAKTSADNYEHYDGVEKLGGKASFSNHEE
jgi:hypothetical protein